MPQREVAGQLAVSSRHPSGGSAVAAVALAAVHPAALVVGLVANNDSWRFGADALIPSCAPLDFVREHFLKGLVMTKKSCVPQAHLEVDYSNALVNGKPDPALRGAYFEVLIPGTSDWQPA
jgi:hypothetical protein